MSTEQTLDLMWADKPVPAARALYNFSATEVGNGEYVFLDNERLEYHTLNESAFAVWQLCDGQRTSRDIAAALSASGTLLAVEAVELAAIELGDAGLLRSAPSSWNIKVTRRLGLKLAAAGALGTGVIPAVTSISVPDSAVAQTTNCCAGGCGNCTAATVCCQEVTFNDRCCCDRTAGANQCQLRSACAAGGGVCLN